MFIPHAKVRVLRGFLHGARLTRRQFQTSIRTNTVVEVQCTQSVSKSLDQSRVLESSVLPASLTSRSPISHPVLTEPPLAYDIVQGSLVRHCDLTGNGVSVPTIVLVHGILGSKKNLRAFARRLLDGYPSWQAILVDLRCHGDSYLKSTQSFIGSNNIHSAARDILQLLNYLKVFPRVLIGHSFGGKVVMSMAEQFGQTLPRPVQAWVLDTLPGEVRNDDSLGEDHPLDLIKTLQSIPLPITSRSHLIDILLSNGFSKAIASWMTTNLVHMDPSQPQKGLKWSFDLSGIEEMYYSYERESLWPFLRAPPVGLKLDFVRAEHSQFRWAGEDQRTIRALGHGVHTLGNAGHWVHTDNPEGLFQILKHSLGEQEFGLSRSNSL